MGLIKQALSTIGDAAKNAGKNIFTNALSSSKGVVNEQYLEYFYCDAILGDVLAVKGQKKDKKGMNKGSDNIISNGSMIVVNAGQCALIVDNGKVAELCAEPGEYIYDASTEPSIFYGNLGKSILASFAELGKRFTFGGEIPKDQRVYYINVNEVRNNLWGTSNPIPFYVQDPDTGFAGSIGIIANGEYTFHISDPIRFYTSISSNFTDTYTKKDLVSIMKSDFMTALQPAIASLSQRGVDANGVSRAIMYDQIPLKTADLVANLNSALSAKWGRLRGMEVIDVTFNHINPTPEDEKTLKDFQKTAVYSNNTRMLGARLGTAQANAMEAAASNTEAGPMMAFAGMNMAQMTGGLNSAQLFNIADQQGVSAPGQAQAAPNMVAAAAAGGWKCSCGTMNTAKFCSNCGSAKPADAAGWTCSCGAVNKGKFCAECGAKKPAGAPLYKCDKCGWEPEDPQNPPKFCPECGDVFDENDQVQ